MDFFFVIVSGGEVYAPEPLGRRSVLVGGGRVLALAEDAGALRRGLDTLGVPYDVIDAAGHLVLPGLIDPHEHVDGAAGEQGFGSRSEPVRAPDLALAGVTTVVGVLGADTTTRHLTAILGRVRQLAAGGLSAFMYTGGYPVPPPTITGSVRDDLVLIPEVIGVGELAVSDQRSTEPQVTELARLAGEAQVGGAIGGKAGVVHFHVGGGQRRLACLRALLDEHEVEPRHLYPTHLNRSEALLEEGVELARRTG